MSKTVVSCERLTITKQEEWIFLVTMSALQVPFHGLYWAVLATCLADMDTLAMVELVSFRLFYVECEMAFVQLVVSPGWMDVVVEGLPGWVRKFTDF